ncbi:protein of unknown function [Methylorubrum extorquens]|uniref:Uncharacterized protein n=1 Tax=Methylorubrum extorquens TaxID=408 RepID=A0A2N9AQV2_METEX|nr:protein of unknown function [Methylorubrum extorquens]
MDLVPRTAQARLGHPLRRAPDGWQRTEPDAALRCRRHPPRDAPTARRRPAAHRTVEDAAHEPQRRRLRPGDPHLRGHTVLCPLAARLDARWRGGAARARESLSLTRFRNPLVRLMLPFRMPRRIG